MTNKTERQLIDKAIDCYNRWSFRYNPHAPEADPALCWIDPICSKVWLRSPGNGDLGYVRIKTEFIDSCPLEKEPASDEPVVAAALAQAAFCKLPSRPGLDDAIDPFKKGVNP